MAVKNLSHRIRSWHLRRQADQLLRRACADKYQPSQHLVGSVTPAVQIPDCSRRPWFVIVVILTAVMAGYVMADDARIEAVNACVARR